MLSKKLVTGLKLNVEYLEQLQEAVGKWHDVVVAHEMLSLGKSKNKKVLDIFEKETNNALDVIKKLAAPFTVKIRAKAA